MTTDYNSDIYEELMVTLIMMPKDLIKLMIEYKGHQIEGKYIGKLSNSSIRSLGITTNGHQIYAIDFMENKIIVLNENGELLLQWGCQGTGNRCFNGPISLIVHNSLIYITDTYNKRVQIFGLNGDFVKIINCGDECWGITILQSQIYVSFPACRIIKVYTLDGEFIREFTHTDLNPSGLTTLNDKIYVADIWKHKIICFSDQGKYQFELNNWWYDKNSWFYWSMNVYAQSLYVCDGQSFIQFDEYGNFIRRSSEFNKDQVKNPACMTVLNGKCFVIDNGIKQISIFK